MRYFFVHFVYLTPKKWGVLERIFGGVPYLQIKIFVIQYSHKVGERRRGTIGNAECRMQNAEWRMQNAKCKVQSAECRVQNAKYRVQSAECRMENSEWRIVREHCMRGEGGLQGEEKRKEYKIYRREGEG